MNVHFADNNCESSNYHEDQYGHRTKIERYEPQVNTSSLYKTYNLPERFENTRKFYFNTAA